MSASDICESIDDLREFRLSLIGELRRLVQFDAFAWLLTDPTSEVGSDPVADVPCLPELPRLIRLKYATDVNRWTGQTTPVARLHDITGGRLDRSLVWRELLCDYDVSDVVSIVFRDRYGCWAFLDLWRCDGVFHDDHAQVLADHVSKITAALRRCTLRTFDPSNGYRHRATGPVVLLLSERLEVMAQTPETEGYLRRLVPPDAGQPPVPAGAYNVAAQLLAAEAGIDDNQPVARVHLGGDEWLTMRAARIGEGIAIAIEATPSAERLDLLGRSAGLTPREMELLNLLGSGADTRTLAGQMFVSEHTVQDHLKTIFTKTGMSSRRDLIARTVTS